MCRPEVNERQRRRARICRLRLNDGRVSFFPADKGTVIKLIPFAAAMVTGRKVNRSQVITTGNGTCCFVPTHINGAYHLPGGGVSVRPLRVSERNFHYFLAAFLNSGRFQRNIWLFWKIIEPLCWQIKARSSIELWPLDRTRTAHTGGAANSEAAVVSLQWGHRLLDPPSWTRNQRVYG